MVKKLLQETWFQVEVLGGKAKNLNYNLKKIPK
jgi:hypothetical protein